MGDSNQKANGYDFFVSYTRADEAWATWIAWQLEESGFTVLVQAWDFRPGGDFLNLMRRGLAVGTRTLAVLSPRYLGSPFAMAEWNATFTTDPSGEFRNLVPVRIAAVDLPALDASRIWIDLVGVDETEARRRLIEGISKTRAKPSSPPAYPANAAPDFPGPPEPAEPRGEQLRLPEDPDERTAEPSSRTGWRRTLSRRARPTFRGVLVSCGVVAAVVGLMVALRPGATPRHPEDVGASSGSWRLPSTSSLSRFTIDIGPRIGILEGRIASDEEACVGGRRIRVYRLTDDGGRIAGVTFASSSGEWSVKTTGMPGFYVAQAGEVGGRTSDVICERAASPPVNASVVRADGGDAKARAELVSLLKNAGTVLEIHASENRGTYRAMDSVQCDAYKCHPLLTKQGFTADRGYIAISATKSGYCVEGQHIDASIVMSYRSSEGTVEERPCPE